MSNDVRHHFSARDLISRWDGARAYRRQTSFAAALFFENVAKRSFLFPIKAIQIDGGSEFKKDFEEAVRKRGIQLFVIPPHSPKLNGHVERANRTHREEFYEVETIGSTMEEHNPQLERWENTCNYIRPHQGLDYLTPRDSVGRGRWHRFFQMNTEGRLADAEQACGDALVTVGPAQGLPDDQVAGLGQGWQPARHEQQRGTTLNGIDRHSIGTVEIALEWLQGEPAIRALPDSGRGPAPCSSLTFPGNG